MLAFCGGPQQAVRSKEVFPLPTPAGTDGLFDCCSSGKLQLCVQRISSGPEARHLLLQSCVDQPQGSGADTDAGPKTPKLGVHVEQSPASHRPMAGALVAVSERTLAPPRAWSISVDGREESPSRCNDVEAPPAPEALLPPACVAEPPRTPPRMPKAEADWSSGSVRVLLVTGASDSVASSTLTNSGIDGATQIERWCRRCGIADVTLLPLRMLEDEAASRQAICAAGDALAGRCLPGDTCVLYLAVAACGKFSAPPKAAYEGRSPSSSSRAHPSSTLDADAEDSVGVDGVLWREVLFVDRLPERVTLVCLGDSIGGVSLLGLADDSFETRLGSKLRVVRHLIVPDPTFLSDLVDGAGLRSGETVDKRGVVPASFLRLWPCAAAILRAADALSLADGPCSLSCRDFLTEVGEQACDLVVAAGLPIPRVTLRCHPGNSIAEDVRWPIAAAPRNKATSTDSLSPSSSSPTRQQATITDALSPSRSSPTRYQDATTPIAISCSTCSSRTGFQFMPPEIELRQASDASRRGAFVVGGGKGRDLGRQPSASKRTAMPTDIGSFVGVFTGGAIGASSSAAATTVGGSRGSPSPCRQAPNYARREQRRSLTPSERKGQHVRNVLSSQSDGLR